MFEILDTGFKRFRPYRLKTSLNLRVKVIVFRAWGHKGNPWVTSQRGWIQAIWGSTPQKFIQVPFFIILHIVLYDKYSRLFFFSPTRSNPITPPEYFFGKKYIDFIIPILSMDYTCFVFVFVFNKLKLNLYIFFIHNSAPPSC